MINDVISLPYKLARLPLVIIDKGLTNRMSETSGPRVLLDRTIGTADKVAGGLLSNASLERSGTERLERSDKLVMAARLEGKAAASREQADLTASAGRQEAAEKRKAAKDRVVSGLEEADTVEARGKQQAATRAADVASQKKASADQRAASRAAEVEQRKERVESAAEARKSAVRREAKATLDDAREDEQSAADAKADADRLSKLADAKKRQRTSK